MYATPAGAGGKDGTNWANAFGVGELETDMTDNAEAGDIYYVAGGTYTLTGAFSTVKAGTNVAVISVIGVDTGTSNEPPVFSDFAFGANRPVIAAGANTFVFTGGQWHYQNLSITTTEASGFKVGADDVVYNCKANNSSGVASRRAFIAAAISIHIGCEGQSTAGWAIETAGSMRIYACYLHDSVVGVRCGAGVFYVLNSIIDTCATGIDVGTRGDGLLANTTIYNSSTRAISGTTGDHFISLNNIIDASAIGVEWTTVYTNHWFDYNCWGDGNTDDIVDTDVIWGNNRVEDAPAMANPGAGDFTILTSSPCHNVGLDAGDLTGATV